MNRRVIATLVAMLTLLAVLLLPSVAQAQSTSNIAPLNAYGCSKWVCIRVDGSGLWINWIQAIAENKNTVDVDATPKYWRNGTLVHTGTKVHIAVGTKKTDVWNTQQRWNNNDRACVSWVATPKSIPGYPCETIHS